MLARRRWHWTDTAPTVTAADVDRGYIRVHVRDRSTPATSPQEHQERNEYFERLPADQQDELNRETDRRFWERTRYRVGEPLGGSREDRAMAPYWRALRDELLRQRQAIDELPQHVREFLFAKDSRRRLSPRGYGSVLRLAEKLRTLSSSELEDYRNRVEAQTSDWAEFEKSIDRYIVERTLRRSAGERREQLATPLTGLEPLYERYRDYKETLRRLRPAEGRGAVFTPPKFAQESDQLTADLRAAGFASIQDFEEAIRTWLREFRNETHEVAEDLLDRYEHVLFEAELQYRAPGAGAELFQQLTPAREHFREADRIREEFFATGGTAMPWTAEERAYSAEFLRRRNLQLSMGESAVRGLAKQHKLVTDPKLEREELARLPEARIVPYLQHYIRDRRVNIRDARANLAAKPERVYRLPDLLTASYQAQDIQPGSIFDLIVRDHIGEVAREEGVIAVLVAIIAIALGVLSGGTGTVAVLAAVGAAGIGVAQALEEWRKYEEASAEYGAKLLSEEPSFTWVVVAVVGAGLDVAGAVTAFRNVAELRGAVESFNHTRDVAKLRQQLDALKDVDQRLRETIRVAAEAQAAEEARVAAVLAELFPRNVRRVSLFGADLAAEFTIRLTFATWLTARRGVRSFRRFLLEREARALLGEIGQLTPAEIARVGRAYEEARITSARIAAHGRTLGMTEQQIEGFFRAWSRNEKFTPDELMGQMDEFVANIGGGAGRYRTAPEIIIDPKSREVLSDFDTRIAGTGGIERITARRVPEEGRLSVTIEGEILPGMARRARDVAPGKPRAPSFNTSSANVFSKAELGLSDEWEVLHLWGPGFGDEAAAGMMRGPKTVNQLWQNQSIEDYIRLLGQQARREGGSVRLKATAVAWETPTPKGWHAPKGELFLKRAEYRLTLSLPGKPPQPIRVTIDVAEPPAAAIAHWEIDPPSAANLGDLFSTP